MDSLTTKDIRYYYKEAYSKFYKKTQSKIFFSPIRKRRKTINFVGNSNHVFTMHYNLDRRLINKK